MCSQQIVDERVKICAEHEEVWSEISSQLETLTDVLSAFYDISMCAISSVEGDTETVRAHHGLNLERADSVVPR